VVLRARCQELGVCERFPCRERRCSRPDPRSALEPLRHRGVGDAATYSHYFSQQLRSEQTNISLHMVKINEVGLSVNRTLNKQSVVTVFDTEGS
jgi:hypothetical protein